MLMWMEVPPASRRAIERTRVKNEACEEKTTSDETTSILDKMPTDPQPTATLKANKEEKETEFVCFHVKLCEMM